MRVTTTVQPTRAIYPVLEIIFTLILTGMVYWVWKQVIDVLWLWVVTTGYGGDAGLVFAKDVFTFIPGGALFIWLMYLVVQGQKPEPY